MTMRYGPPMHGNRLMHYGWYLELDGHVREEPVQERNDAEEDKERGAELAHEVRRVEEMQDLERAETYREIRREDARDVDAAYLQDLLSRQLQSEQERYRDEENGERARMHAIEQRRDEHERQQPCAAIARAPY